MHQKAQKYIFSRFVLQSIACRFGGIHGRRRKGVHVSFHGGHYTDTPSALKKSLRRSFKTSNNIFLIFLIFVLSNRTKNGKRNSYSPQTIPRIDRKSVLSFAIN